MVRVLLRLIAGFARSRASLVAENEILRLQLAAAKARLYGKRLRFSRSQPLEADGGLVGARSSDPTWRP